MQENGTAPKCEATHSLLKHSVEPQTWYSDGRVGRDSSPAIMSQRRILKNVIFLSATHYLVYQTTITLGNLQSTLNSQGGIGVASLAVKYAMSMLCIFFFSELLIKSFGCKKMLLLVIALELPYYASNFYPTWGTMIPTSVLSGPALGVLPMGVSLYINELSALYHSAQLAESLETITSKFFGIFSFFALNSSIWGNLVSYFILQHGVQFNRTTTNASCGVDFDSSSDNFDIVPPSEGKRDLLVGICLSSIVFSMVLLGVFVDELDERGVYTPPEGWTRGRSVLASLSAAARQAFATDQVLLLPLTVFFGMQTAFYSADFTKAFIACSLGMQYIGFISMFYGACGAVMGCTIGCLVNRTSQMFVMIVAACLNVLVIISLSLWNPSPNSVVPFFIVAGIWGILDATWWTQISAVYGLLFPKNHGAAFSVMYFCVFLGYTYNFSTSNYLSIRVKITVLFIFLIIGISGYIIGQIKIRLAVKRKLASAT